MCFGSRPSIFTYPIGQYLVCKLRCIGNSVLVSILFKICNSTHFHYQTRQCVSDSNHPLGEKNPPSIPCKALLLTLHIQYVIYIYSLWHSVVGKTFPIFHLFHLFHHNDVYFYHVPPQTLWKGRRVKIVTKAGSYLLCILDENISDHNWIPFGGWRGNT